MKYKVQFLYGSKYDLNRLFSSLSELKTNFFTEKGFFPVSGKLNNKLAVIYPDITKEEYSILSESLYSNYDNLYLENSLIKTEISLLEQIIKRSNIFTKKTRFNKNKK